MSELKKGMELKARTARSIADEEEMLELGADCPIEPTQVYIKSEADKAIADLEESHKKEVEQLLIHIREQSNAANRLRDSMERVIRHNKYKRCLAMARLCHERSLWWYSNGYGFEKYNKFWEKWHKRWLELAEKFKEVK